MKNKKAVMVLLIALTVLSLALGVVGYLESGKEKEEKPSITHSVIYRYYLNDIEVEQMPTNPTLLSSSMASSTLDTNNAEKLYAFNTATCTNKVTYKWDENTWTFTTDNSADTTCKLYFVTTYNEITVKATNGTVTPEINNKIKRGEDAVIKITPTEGYEYDKATCTNNEVVEWNKDKNELTVKSIYAQTTCDVAFKLSKFSVEIKVNNGSGATKLEYEYGKKVEVNVTAAVGYGTPTINCTNNQSGEWKSGTYTIDKLTKETICTIDFKQIQNTTASYSVTLDVGSHGVLASGSATQTVSSGGSVNYTIVISDTAYTLEGATCTSGTVTKQSNVLTISNVTQNTTCDVVYGNATPAD